MTLDSQNMLQVIKDFPKQCREALGLPKGISASGKINNIVIAGMGGSAMGGDLLKIYLSNTNIPVYVNRDYKVPNFVDENSLVFAVSYSGNTEETLSALNAAKEKKAQIIGITSGGKLAEECEKVVNIPSGLQPRAALGYLFFPMLGILHNTNIIRVKNDELNEMMGILKQTNKFNEQGEELSKKLKEKIPIIYASEALGAIAFRWKTQINENAKMPAFYNVFSEMNHNEIAGYKSMDHKFSVVMILDKNDNDRVKKRMNICKEIMEEYVEVEEVETQGESLLARMFSAIYLGDYVSYYMALWNRVDPSPVDIIEGMKKKLM
ncbi:MAG: bifunctional phosphoglucose/phosphomannose isomerase [Candidatus Woesearchaeota archaeon]|mgnify:FL=1|nr:bifunctional phosphoglucose/phosphomannose isomerase [Candidatus Woesearchaeota archaeon]MDP7322909.1 bifunctional phosphoglucose/phosphomannose isomerase [Candidatus Woesearchaeota archaeon]HJO01824.1 bifunctional phosphoglucose/phosphomannose isomerase [Candidatus Woesearchaeota archaeon]